MNRNIARLAAVALTALALSGCSASGGTTDSASSPAASSPSAASGPAAPAESGGGGELATATSSLGDIVVDGKGMTVYYFDKDTAGSGVSACAGQCLTNWPAVPAASDSPVVDGVTGEVGVITGTEGNPQLTLNGLPLYYFAGDSAPGDVNGQAVSDVWWVIAPDGEAIH